MVARLYQINWAELSPPSSQSTLQGAKGGLFYRATLRDCTGQMEVFVREKAALAMSSMPSAQAFLAAVEEQDLVVPLLVSLRLVCRSGKDDGKPIFVVVEAGPQNLDEPPSNASQWLLPLIGACPEAAGRVLPARVADLKSSLLYPLMVGDNLVTKALVLLISTEKSKLAQCGDGFFVHTKGLRDAMAADEAKRFSAKALCTLANSIQLKLDGTRYPCSGPRLASKLRRASFALVWRQPHPGHGRDEKNFSELHGLYSESAGHSSFQTTFAMDGRHGKNVPSLEPIAYGHVNFSKMCNWHCGKRNWLPGDQLIHYDSVSLVK